MKIFSCEQIREIDSYTISHEPIASIDLMERAAGKLYSWISEKFSRPDHFMIFTGPGNNGGDGMALARMLIRNGYKADIYNIRFTDKTSKDLDINKQRLRDLSPAALKQIDEPGQIPLISSDDIIIDAIFGSGLGRPVTGLAREVIIEINKSDALKVSVDIPSGLFCGSNAGNDYESIIKADYTLTFQFPKLSFLFPESMKFVGIWKVLPIGLHDSAITNTYTPFRLLDGEDILPLLKTRKKFDHKGVFGHGLLISGSYGKMGAAVLGARAALRTGIGLITCHIPSCGYEILQSSVTESMVIADENERFVSSIPGTDNFTAVGAGPGIGTGEETQAALKNLLTTCRKPMVLDADALNILSLNNKWLELMTPGTILTPHPKEFERLAGKTADSYERLERQREFSKRHDCIVILKGAHSSVSLQNGTVFFNNTGNPGMATAGSGDVLTGMLLSLLAQGYSSEDAAVLGVYIHGLAGDIAAGESSFESLTASDIINCIGRAFNRIRGY